MYTQLHTHICVQTPGCCLSVPPFWICPSTSRFHFHRSLWWSSRCCVELWPWPFWPDHNNQFINSSVLSCVFERFGLSISPAWDSIRVGILVLQSYTLWCLWCVSKSGWRFGTSIWKSRIKRKVRIRVSPPTDDVIISPQASSFRLLPSSNDLSMEFSSSGSGLSSWFEYSAQSRHWRCISSFEQDLQAPVRKFAPVCRFVPDSYSYDFYDTYMRHLRKQNQSNDGTCKPGPSMCVDRSKRHWRFEAHGQWKRCFNMVITNLHSSPDIETWEFLMMILKYPKYLDSKCCRSWLRVRVLNPWGTTYPWPSANWDCRVPAVEMQPQSLIVHFKVERCFHPMCGNCAVRPSRAVSRRSSVGMYADRHIFHGCALFFLRSSEQQREDWSTILLSMYMNCWVALSISTRPAFAFYHRCSKAFHEILSDTDRIGGAQKNLLQRQCLQWPMSRGGHILMSNACSPTDFALVGALFSGFKVSDRWFYELYLL